MRRRATTQSHHGRLRRASVIASSALTAVLIVAKFAIWLMSGSVAMLSSLLDSSLDALSNAVTLLSIYHASRPADFNHRFGHAKAEPLAAFAQCIFISASAVFVAYESLNRLLSPRPVQHTLEGIAVMVASTVALLAVIAYQRHVVQVTGSMAIEAESLNYRGDLLLNASVIASLAVTHLTGVVWVDPAFGLVIVAILVRNSVAIGRRAMAVLMDEEIEPAEREAIREVAMAVEGVRGVHDLRTRHTGQATLIEMHLELDGELSLTDSHEIATRVEDAIGQRWRGAEVLTHQEPHGLDDDKLDQKIGTP